MLVPHPKAQHLQLGDVFRAGGERLPRCSWRVKPPLIFDPFLEFHGIRDNCIHFLIRSNCPGMEERGCEGIVKAMSQTHFFGELSHRKIRAWLGPDPH